MVLRLTMQTLGVLVTAAGLLAALGSSFVIAALFYVWDTEGALQAQDKSILKGAFLWLSGSIPFAAGGWWLCRCTFKNKAADRSFTLVKSRNYRVDKLVERLSLIALIAYVVALLSAGTAGAVFSRVTQVFGWVLIGFLALHLQIWLHELSHLCAARALRFRLIKIQVGAGRVGWSGSFANGLRCTWRLWPAGGFVCAVPRENTAVRLRQFLVVAAGPLCDIVILGSVVWFTKAQFGSLFAAFSAGAGGVLLGALFLCAIVSTIAGLLPHTFSIGSTTVWSDGYWLFRLCAFPRRGIEALAVGYDPAEALTLLLDRGVEKPPSATPSVAEGDEQPPAAKTSDFEQLRARLAAPLLPCRSIMRVSRSAKQDH